MIKENQDSNRRDFLKTSVVTAGGLLIAFHIPLGRRNQAFADTGAAPSPNAFIEIKPDNSIIITINHLEMGQGINTSMSQLIAEELDCDWNQISAISAPVNPIFNTPFGMQMTGGSSSLKQGYDQYRKIGASMREMLKSAAAKKWGIASTACHTEKGFVISEKGKFSYGELTADAAKLPIPENIPLREARDFKVIGQSLPRVDAREKSTGQAIFGMDVRLPKMLYAVIQRPPLPDSKLLSFDASAAKKIPAVIDVVRFGDSVAVLAKDTWSAKLGRDSLNAKYDMRGSEKMNSADLFTDFKKSLSEEPGVVVDKRGDIETALKKAHKKLEATYEFPYLAHATMEPLNCTISFDGHTAELWSGHQMPTWDQAAVAEILGIKKDKVQIHTVYAGGSFGRRGSKTCDFVSEAARLAKIVKKPLKIVWTREDDMRGGYYRPMNVHHAVLAFDEHNHFLGWKHQIAGQSVVANSAMEKMLVHNGVESVVVEGVAQTPYEINNFYCDCRRPRPNMTTLWWRSVGHTHTAYVAETVIDEIAHQMKKDALQLRKEWLKNSPRHLAVLHLLEKHSPWGKTAPKGHAYGLAVHESFDTVVGHVVDVSMVGNSVKVHRVWSAVDCGQVVNPDGAKAQVEGAFVFGLSAALYGEVGIQNGQIIASNFNDYPVVRMDEMPKMEIHFTQSTAAPTGLGEPGLPPAAPAIANALFKLTGKRMRKLPLSKNLV